MPRDKHYAIAIGLKSYPGLKNPPADLQGPENDVESICKWLLAPTGGDLPPGNVKKIITSDFAESSDEPWAGHLNRLAFEWIEGFATKNVAAGIGRTVGDRLYIYMSGHGFSTVQRVGCLLTADAAPNKVDANISASAWMNWWQDAGYFHEFVLLLDTCMNRMSIAVPNPPPLAWVNNPVPPGPAFAAFAAKRPLKAVEAPVAKGDGSVEYHGVFTSAFLDGVNGAAVNSAGTVTGQSMANWLRNALPQRLGEADRTNPEISIEPEIIAESPQIVLARGIAAMTFDIELQFEPDAVGKPAHLWSGTPPRALRLQTLAVVTVKLPAGLHVIEVPETGYRQGFEVTQSATVRVAAKGPNVTVTLETFDLSINGGDPANQISIETAGFETVDNGKGQLVARLRCGIYRARIRVARDLVDQVFLLDRDLELGSGALPRIASAIPFRDAPLSHENQSDLVDHLAGQSDPEPGRAQIAVVARSWTAEAAAVIDSPWEDVRVVDSRGREIANLSKAGTKDKSSKDGIAYQTVDVRPTIAFLRFRKGSAGITEMVLPTIAGWRLEAYLLRFNTGEQEAPPRVSFVMRNGNDAPPHLRVYWSAVDNDRFEKASIALADERPILNYELEELLLRKYKNPLEGIVGAHLLLIQYETDRSVDLNDLNIIVTNLRQLVGTEHPDVEALSMRCPDASLRRKKPFTAPPLFERSWRLMVEASQQDRSLVPLALWNRVAALSTMPPYLAWSANREVKKTYRSALLDNLDVAAPLSAPVTEEMMSFEVVAPKKAAAPSSNALGRAAKPQTGRGATKVSLTDSKSAASGRTTNKPATRSVASRKPKTTGFDTVDGQTGVTSTEAQALRFALAYQLPASALKALQKKRGT